jgi:glycosyltransferase involved in cell wall biosynthesis
MPPTLSILITYYNERHLLTECLRSVLGQLGAADEVLVYDDCSAHPPGPFIPPGVPARVIRGEANIGPARGRNRLLQEATGEYIHFHDSDDLFAPGWADRIRAEITNGLPDWVITEVASFDENGPIADQVMGIHQLTSESDLVQRCIRGAFLVPSGTYRRDAVLSIGGYRESLWQSEDFDFHVRLAARSVRFRLVPEPLVRIRLHAKSRSRKVIEVWESDLDMVNLLSNELESHYHPDLAELASIAAAHLFRAGRFRSARRGFALARRLGPPIFQGRPRAYKFIATYACPEVAEVLGGFWRVLFPERLRRHLRECGLPSARAFGQSNQRDE